MPDLTRFRPILWAAVGVCLLAGLVAVPIVDDGSGDRVAAGDGGWAGVAPSASSTSVVAGTLSAEGTEGDAAGGAAAAPAGDGGDGGGGGGGASTAGSAGTSIKPGPTNAPVTPAPTEAPASTSPPTTAAPAEDLGAPGDPGPARPPRAGVYRYKVTAAGETRDTTTTIEDRGTTGADVHQLVRSRGEGFDIDSDVTWRTDGVHVLSSVIMFGTNKGSCDWEPDILELRLPAARGTTWESASTCSMTGIGPTPIPVSRKITGKFVELRRVRVAGQVVDVWAIEGTERIEAAGRVTDRAGTTLFSPKHGFAVSSSGTVTSADGTTDYRKELQNLDPE